MNDKELDIESIGSQIVDSAFKVHKALGPGLLESAYQACLAYELQQRGLSVQTEVPQPIVYDCIQVDVGYRLDMLVDGCVIIENKAVEKILPIHQAQLSTYLKLSGCKLGYLINWNTPLLKDGLKRMVWGYPR